MVRRSGLRPGAEQAELASRKEKGCEMPSDQRREDCSFTEHEESGLQGEWKRAAKGETASLNSIMVRKTRKARWGDHA